MKVKVTEPAQSKRVTLPQLNEGQFAKGSISEGTPGYWFKSVGGYYRILDDVLVRYEGIPSDVYVETLPIGTSIVLTSEA